jgi:sugar phosphate isomerase/epimerase
MHPRISVNGISSMQWTLEQDIAFARRTGLSAISVPYFKLEAVDGGVTNGIRAIEHDELRPVLVVANLLGILTGGPEVLKAFQSFTDAAAALGAPSVSFMSGTIPARMTTDDAFPIFVIAMESSCDYAAARGVRLALEHNSSGSRQLGFVHSLADAVALAEVVDIDICVELQTCWYERNLERLFRDNANRFSIVQVSDFLVGEESRLNRRVPGDGTMPLEWLIGRLLDSGYPGYFDVEILGPHIESEGYEGAILRSVEWLDQRLHSWGV